MNAYVHKIILQPRNKNPLFSTYDHKPKTDRACLKKTMSNFGAKSIFQKLVTYVTLRQTG